MIVGGETYNNGMETLNSVELFNVQKNQSYPFRMLDIAVKHHVGVNFINIFLTQFLYESLFQARL